MLEDVLRYLRRTSAGGAIEYAAQFLRWEWPRALTVLRSRALPAERGGDCRSKGWLDHCLSIHVPSS